MTILERLKHEMTRLGISEQQLAERTAQLPNTVKSWMAWKDEPHAGALAAMARAGIDVHWVLTERPGAADTDESTLLQNVRRCDIERKQRVFDCAADAAVESEPEYTLKAQPAEIILDLSLSGE